MSRFPVTLAWLTLLATLTSAAPARATGAAPAPDPRWVGYLASKDLYSPAEIQRELSRVTARPLSSPQLSFEMLVPKTFQERPVTVSDRAVLEDRDQPVPLLDMAPKGAKDVALEVRYLRVAPSIPLDRVLLTYAHASGLAVLLRQRGAFNGRPVEEALLRLQDQRLGAFLVRLTLSRRGDLVFFVAGTARESDFARYSRPFGAAAVSFAPLSPAK